MTGKRVSSENTFLDTIATRFDGIHSNFVLGNAQAHGWPIVYCSDGFCELTGYARAQVMAKGCACKFLYGEETSENETKTIDDALENKREHKTELVLYKKNGNPFWCLMDIVPIKNEKRQVVLFLVSHKDISREKAVSTPESRLTDINDNNGNVMEKDGDSNKSDDENTDEMPENYNYSRRRSRAVLYHISGQLNRHNKTKSKLQQLNRLGSQMPEYKVQEVKKSKLVIVHYGIFKIGWDWLILLCTFYIAIMVPFNAAFRKQGRYKDFIYIDPAVEVLFGIDIVLNFRTSYVNKNGQVCYDSRLIALNYMRGWFLLDLLAAIPFDLLYAFDVDTGTLIHLLKVARLLRLARLLQKIERYSQYSVFVVAILMCMFALLAHWLACIWYAIGKQELEDNPSNWTGGWLHELSQRISEPIYNKTHPDTISCYVTALYFTCSSLTSVGFGNVSANTNAEKIFSVCAMLVGAMMHAVVFGNVTAFIQRMYARRANFHAKSKDLKEFFRFHHFPKPLKTRMQEYFQTMWSVNNGIDVRDIMKDFPEDLRGEIGLHLHREILLLPIFEHATQGCLRSVALQTSRVFFGPGEVLIHKGDAIRYIYYVCSGSMEVLKDEQVVAILGKGDLFGSDIRFEEPVSISGCDVRSLAYCELLCINTQGLVESLQPYPEFSEKFQKEFPNDLTYNLREGHEDIQDDDTILPAINTLPVISEDEEDEMDEEDDGDSRQQKSASGDEDDSEHPEQTTTSPLLAKLKSSFSNGDLTGGFSFARSLRESRLGRLIRNRSLKRSESTKDESVPCRRGGASTQTPTYMRNMTSPLSTTSRVQRPSREKKIRSCRTLPVINPVSVQKSEEAILVHKLQKEIEGTRNSVDKLDKRMESLNQDVKKIASSLELLLRNFGSQQPPTTPNSSSQSTGLEMRLGESHQPNRLHPQDQSNTSPKEQASPSILSHLSPSNRPQFFFGAPPEVGRFSEIFTSACPHGRCRSPRDEVFPAVREFPTVARPSPTLSPVSQSSFNSCSRLLGSDDERSSPRFCGRDVHSLKTQYYKGGGVDSDRGVLVTNIQALGSPTTPLSPLLRLDSTKLTENRGKGASFLMKALKSPYPENNRQTGNIQPFILDLSSGSEESLNEPKGGATQCNSRYEAVRAPLIRPESISDLASVHDTTEV